MKVSCGGVEGHATWRIAKGNIGTPSKPRPAVEKAAYHREGC